MLKTRTSPKHTYIFYMTKHLRQDLHDRMRVQASMRGITLEDVLNVILETGLPEVERVTMEERRARKRAAAAG